MSHKTKVDSRHAIAIEFVDIYEGHLLDLQVSVVHPDGCTFDNCPLVYTVESIGVMEGLNFHYYGVGGWKWDQPTWDLLRAAFTTSRGVIPITYRFWYGWSESTWVGPSEYDEELYWWPR